MEPDRLRFDFQHSERVTPEQRRQVELIVNDFVRRNVPAQIEHTMYADAIRRDVLAFFGATYGENVRMVRFDGVSAELCGGSHVHATCEIGTFRIVSESSVASAVRRIIALTSEEALRLTQRADAILEAISDKLFVTLDNLETQVETLLERSKQKTVAAPASKYTTDELKVQVSTAPDGMKYLFLEVDRDPAGLRTMALEAAESLDALVVLVSNRESKLSVVVTVPKSLTGAVKANGILSSLLATGGGRAHLAQGGAQANVDATVLRKELSEALAGGVAAKLTAIIRAGCRAWDQ